MTDDRSKLEEELHGVEARIEALEERIPPHSVKPHFIRQLDELEAERDRIIERLTAMKTD